MQSVHNFLRNVRYVGDANSLGKIAEGRQQPLITRGLWDKVNGMLKVSANQPAKRSSNTEAAIFQVLVFCGHCKRPMAYRWSRQIVTGFRRHTFWQGLSSADRQIIYRLFLRSITVFRSSLELRMNLPVPGVADELKRMHYIPTNAQPEGDIHLEETECLFVKVPVAFRTISGRKQIVKNGGSAAPAKPTQQQLNTTMAQGTVMKSSAKAIAWMKMIDEGKAASISQLAELVGVDSVFCIGGS